MKAVTHSSLKYLSIIFAVLAVVYFFVSMFYFGSNGQPSGDEFIFTADMDKVINNGWSAAIESKISIPYMLFAYPFTFIMDNIWALRIVNLMVLIALFLYFFKIVKIENRSFYFYLLFYIATVNFFFSGVNDPMFILGLVVFFTEVFYFVEKGKMNNVSLAFTAVILSFFTRELILIYMPAVIFGCFVLYKNGFRLTKKQAIVPLMVLLFFTVLNIPSLMKNHRLSYDNKQAPEGLGVNWTQRQYLAQLLVNEGRIKNFSHPSWEETKAYLEKNGPHSLPSNAIEGMTHDIKLTITEFFKDFFYSLIYGFRQLGIMILFPFCFVISEWYYRKKWTSDQYIPTIFIMVTGMLSLIIISFMELRWLASVFIPLILFYSIYSKKSRYSVLWSTCNYLVLCAFSLYGLYKVLIRF